MTVLPLSAPAPTALSAALPRSSGVNMSPDASQLPGYDLLHALTNGLGGWALIAAMLGIVIGAVMWAFGHYSQNYQQALNGRRGVLVWFRRPPHRRRPPDHQHAGSKGRDDH